MDPDLFSCSFSSSFFAPSAPLYYFPSGKSLPLFYTDKGKREEQERTGRKKASPSGSPGKRPLVSAPYACLFKEQKKKKVGSSRLKGREKERELVYLVPRILPPCLFPLFIYLVLYSTFSFNSFSHLYSRTGT